MSLYVVDASVAIKLYVPEVHSAQAVRFFSDGHELIVPEFMLAEVANIVWRLMIRKWIKHIETLREGAGE